MAADQTRSSAAKIPTDGMLVVMGSAAINGAEFFLVLAVVMQGTLRIFFFTVPEVKDHGT